MRKGTNPLTGKRVTSMPPLVAAVITHLPHQRDYHAGRLEIVQTCLRTMRDNAGRDIEVYVWDNGSCKEFRSWLQYDYKPDYLTLSPNIGKTSARTAIVRAFPPETTVCVSDDDMFFHPGWLDPQLKLLNTFPNVGQVSGYPVRTQFKWGTQATMAWAERQKDVRIKVGRFISEEYDRDFCHSIGRDYDWHVNYTKDVDDVLLEYHGVKAYATAHHCQFITVAGRIENIVQWTDEAMSDERLFDNAIDQQGLLRLTTTQRYVQHIGNVMDDEFKIQSLNFSEAVYA